MVEWTDAQEWESNWWDKCQNTYGEEEKQVVYAHRMGLRMVHDGRSPYNIDMQERSVVDIGGGPVSLLLKCFNLGLAVVVDPLVVPEWVYQRYNSAGITLINEQAEAMSVDEGKFDEAWIYNCLQHTEDPHTVVRNALNVASYVRVFEWLDTRVNEGHPHTFTKEILDDWLMGDGKVEVLQGEANCYGKCYYGIFRGSTFGSQL